LVVLYASYDGYFGKGEKCKLFGAALQAVQSMKEGDKVFIMEEEADETKEKPQKELIAERAMRLSYVYFS
jgi:hypothetical protein